MSALTAMWRRDLRLQVSYRLQLVAQLAALLLTLLSYRFLSRLVPGDQPALQPFGGDYFTFVLIGGAAATFFVVGTSSFADTLQREQDTGTLEALFVTPNSPTLLLLGGVAFPFAFSLVQMLLFAAAGAVFLGAHLAGGNFLAAAAILILSVVAFSAMGMVAAAFMIHTKRAAVVIGFADILFTVVGGVMYPLSALPGWLQVLAHFLPISYSLDALRRVLSATPDWGRVGLDCLALSGFALIFVPLATAAFTWSVKRARMRGSLAQY